MEVSHHLTPYQSKLIQEARERRARIAARAIPDKPVICLSASARVESAAAPIVEVSNGQALPPIPNEAIADAADIAFPAWVNDVKKIQHAVCKEFGVRRVDLLSERRTRALVVPRQIAMYLCKRITHRSLPDIGRRFGGRDHTTVLHGIRKAEALLASDPAMRSRIEILAEALGESLE